MFRKNHLITFLLFAVAVCLFKLAFFPGGAGGVHIVPPAHADGGIIEWDKSRRIVTTGKDGAETFVWDYDGKTQVRKYSIKGNKLVLKVFRLED